MNKTLLLTVSCVVFVAACSKTPTPVSNSAPAPAQGGMVSVPSHGNPPAAASSPASTDAGGKSKWTRSGDPIDTTALDAAIAKADKSLQASPSSAEKKVALASAYTARGTALTNARQYASALGDFRRALKLDPSNSEAKAMLEQIISIYESINRDYPKEGEEPAALKK